MEFLNYHHLRYFWAVAKEGGLGKAAEKLRISQPAISAQIRALEETLGEKLFRRSGRGLTLTEVGHQVFSYADEIISLGHELLESVKQRPSGRPLRIHIGVTDILPKLVTCEIIKPIFTLGQPVHLICRETKTAELLALMATYRLDIVLADEPAPASIHVKTFNHLLGECGISFCAEPKLAAKLKRRFPQSLNLAPALLPTADTAIRRSLEKWFQTFDIRPSVVAEIDDSALMKAMAAEGLGFVPVPSVVAKEAVSHYGFRIIGASEDCRQQFYAITQDRKLTNPAVVAITSSARKVLFA
ncbi:MAG: LysR family transcriptional regulator [Verrucomicrobia bacterium]|nr:LysR family transcriptional regulator [Verrucomicrobiota bacterium]